MKSVIGNTQNLQTPSMRVKSVRFSVLDSETIVKMGTCEITTSVLNEKQNPRDNSLNDTRMGSCDPRIPCARCHNDWIICNGHTGFLRLPVKVFHVSYVGALLKILRSVCPHCLQLLARPDDLCFARALLLPEDQRFSFLSNHLKTKKRCPHCETLVPMYTQQGLNILRKYHEDKKKNKKLARKNQVEMPSEILLPCEPNLQLDNFPTQDKNPTQDKTTAKDKGIPMPPAEIQSLMRAIDDQTFRTLGLRPHLSHPANFVLDVLLVPPPIIRPSITFGSTQRKRGQDDLTQRLQEIYKLIERLKKPDIKDRDRLLTLLQAQVATYMNKDCSTGKLHMKRRSGRPMKSLTSRLKSKGGRPRRNLNGKRVDFSGRGPISPDPNIAVDEIGVPEHIAKVLTFPEPVHLRNLTHLQSLVDSGRAQSVDVRATGDTIQLQHLRGPPYRLQLGDVVHRFIRNGDIAIVNRAPTLRKLSIMAHKVRISKTHTIGVNECLCPAYAGYTMRKHRKKQEKSTQQNKDSITP